MLRGVILPLDVDTVLRCYYSSVRLCEPTLCRCVVGVRAVHRLRASSQDLTNHAATSATTLAPGTAQLGLTQEDAEILRPLRLCNRQPSRSGVRVAHPQSCMHTCCASAGHVACTVALLRHPSAY